MIFVYVVGVNLFVGVTGGALRWLNVPLSALNVCGDFKKRSILKLGLKCLFSVSRHELSMSRLANLTVLELINPVWNDRLNILWEKRLDKLKSNRITLEMDL